MIFIILLRSFLFNLIADDTNLLYADKDLKSLESVMNIESQLQQVCNWLNANKLTISAKKSNFVIFRPSEKKLSYQINTRIYNNASNSDTFLEGKDYVKFLGVLIDNNLTGKYHIDYIASKIFRVVEIMSRLRHSVPLNTLIQVYRSDVPIYTLRNCCLEPTCTGLSKKGLYLTKTSSSANVLCWQQISCYPFVCLYLCRSPQYALFCNCMFSYARRIYQFCASEYLWIFYLFIWPSYI